MSSSSAQFRSRVFLHSIPLCVQLPDSLRSTAEIHSVYISARGISYPPLVVAQVLALLNVASSSAEQRYQLTCNGERIRDSHPISVLASLYPSDSPLQLKLIPAPDGTMPEGSVPGAPYNRQESCRQSYQSLLKASDALRFGSTRRTTSLSRDETLSLFDMIQSQSLQVVEFWKVFSRLIDPPSAGSNEKWSKVGCCFYLPQGSEVSMDGPLISLSLKEHLQKSVPTLGGNVTFHSNGIDLTGDENMGWLGTNLVGADGWVRVVLRSTKVGETSDSAST